MSAPARGGDAPRALVVTSVGASPAAVMPVVAALEVAGLGVRAIDVGRAGSRGEGAVDWIRRALAGELAERRLVRELGRNPPDVALAFDPGTATALAIARDETALPAPVVAVVDELAPAGDWGACDADRYLVIDDEAAVDLAEAGVPGEQIMTVGPIAPFPFAQAAALGRQELRARFGLAGSVVVVEVAGLGYQATAEMALQLSLLGREATYLFDAGGDAEAATALRREVPRLDLRAKLFGRSEEAPLFWRCAEVVVARPHPEAVARALVLGARMVAFSGEGRMEQTQVRALEVRELGVGADNTLLIGGALERVLSRPARCDDRIAMDGAANVADVAWLVARERRAVLEERRVMAREETRSRVGAQTSAAEQVKRATAAAGALEDLSTEGATPAGEAPGPDGEEIARLQAVLAARKRQVGQAIHAAREAAETWDARRAAALAQGDAAAAAAAEKSADRERARMHEGLGEAAEIETQREKLARAADQARAASKSRGAAARPAPGVAASASRSPGVDEQLERLKREHARRTDTGPAGRGGVGAEPAATTSGRTGAPTVEEELAALKQKMGDKKRTP